MELFRKYALKGTVALLALLAAGCGEKTEDQKLPDPVTLASTCMQDSVVYAWYGEFEPGQPAVLTAASEINSPEEWGIKFYRMSVEDSTCAIDYTTPLLKGSFIEGKVELMTLPGASYKGVYYNSLDYFAGSSLGEVFAYLIDFHEQEVYSAHLYYTPDEPVSLFLSENCKEGEIGLFFKNEFQKSYPEVIISGNDYQFDL